jgi:HAD superfamily hydrolase (TIGR01490 family)
MPSTPAGGPPDSPRPILAFFDVDNTLMRGASIFHIGTAAWRAGTIRLRDVLSFLWAHISFISVGENPRHQLSVRERGLALVAGRTEEELAQLAVDCFERSIHQRLFPETVALAREHQAKGHEVWLLSATPEAMATVIAQKLGLTGAIGTRIHSIDGVFTGELDGPVMHGQRKADVAESLATERGARLADCWAYSDSRNDIPLLALVGKRVVVNPDGPLARHARRNAWPMLTARAASVRAARKRIRREARAVRRSGS